jgi:polar amino acid transport system substrate-binding protein
MRAIAGKMGVKAELRDIAFSGLLGALQLGQVDAVIAAMTVTQGRSEEVDFSYTYYVGTDGILAAPNKGALPVAAADDLGGRKIGVQSASFYVGWVRENLIDRGKSAEGDLFLFDNLDQALIALDRGDVEVVMMDALAARDYARQGHFQLIGQGLTRQLFSIAVRKGSALAAPINDAIETLQQDGTITALAKQYLAVDEQWIVAVPTPGPTAVPTPAPCIPSMAYVADLNFDDRNGAPTVQPGQGIPKRWRLRNSGNCPWNTQYRFIFAGGESMSGQPTAITQAVPPGGTYDITVNLVAPQAPGQYRTYWQMVDDQSQPFGERVWTSVQIPGAVPTPVPQPPAPQPVPVPTMAPAPQAPIIQDFHAKNKKVAVGLCGKVNWQVAGAIYEVKLKRNGSDWKTGLDLSGSKKDCPSSDGKRSYELVVRGPGGEVRQSLTIKYELIPLAGDVGEAPGGGE